MTSQIFAVDQAIPVNDLTATSVPQVAVIVASVRRPEHLGNLLERLAGQSVLPRQVVLSLVHAADAPKRAEYPFAVSVILGSSGLTLQRNRGLDGLLPDIDVALFYDDDFVPSRFAIAGVASFFAAPEVAGATGLVIQDGILGPGIAPAEALQIVNTSDEQGNPNDTGVVEYRRSLYGCNMAYRLSAIGGLRFDEGLPLYGWLEDMDFGGQIEQPLAYTKAFFGVHCGEKHGRETTGRRLGYSQICNPVYMWRKGTVGGAVAFKLILRNLIANHVKFLWPEPWIDRRGRATGNWIAIADLLRDKARPARMLEL